MCEACVEKFKKARKFKTKKIPEIIKKSGDKISIDGYMKLAMHITDTDDNSHTLVEYLVCKKVIPLIGCDYHKATNMAKSFGTKSGTHTFIRLYANAGYMKEDREFPALASAIDSPLFGGDDAVDAIRRAHIRSSGESAKIIKSMEDSIQEMGDAIISMITQAKAKAKAKAKDKDKVAHH